MKERGQAFLALLAVLFLAGSAVFFTLFSPAGRQLRDDEQTAKIMAAAKVALIGFAASSATRPGQLPCPDMNNDGVAESADSSGCPSGKEHLGSDPLEKAVDSGARMKAP